MNLIKKFWNKIKNPHGIYLALFFVCFLCVTSATISLVVINPQQTILHYFLYFVSATLLAYFVYVIVIISPKIKKFIISLLQKNKFTKKLYKDYGYRTILFSVFSFIFNVSYMAYLGVLAFLNKSYWYFAANIYYLLLSLTKAFIFRRKYKNKTKSKEISTYKYCGIMFIFFTVALGGMISLLYSSNYLIDYAGITIYVVAVYTFYRISLAIYNFFKAKKQDNLYIEAIRNVNLGSAIVSLVILQVALLQAFSATHDNSIFNLLTGCAAAIILLSIGISMITKAATLIKYRLSKKKNLVETRETFLADTKPTKENTENKE